MMGDAKDCDTCEYEHELASHPACAGCAGGNWKPKPETVLAQKDKTIAELRKRTHETAHKRDKREAQMQSELAGWHRMRDEVNAYIGDRMHSGECRLDWFACVHFMAERDDAKAQLAALRDALEEIAHNHEGHSRLLGQFPQGRAWSAASTVLSWAQDIAKAALAAGAGKGDAMTWREASAHADADFRKIEAGSREVREADGEELRKLMGDDAGTGW